MVSTKTLGGVIAGAAVGFGGILYLVISSLTAKNAQLGCVATTPGCMQVATGLSVSHLAVGFISAMLSLGLYFLFFHKDSAATLVADENARRSREEQLALLGKVMTSGERAVLASINEEPGILQATLTYRTNLTPGRISQVLSRLEEQGLVTRRPQGRSYKVYLAL